MLTFQDFLNEGAFSNNGLYWIRPEGTIEDVNQLGKGKWSHEEWAHNVHNTTLEDLFKQRWIRIQAVQPSYLYIDHRMKSIPRAQQRPLVSFFMKPDFEPIPYRQYVVERFNNDMKDFAGNQMSDALEFAISGKTPDQDF